MTFLAELSPAASPVLRAGLKASKYAALGLTSDFRLIRRGRTYDSERQMQDSYAARPTANKLYGVRRAYAEIYELTPIKPREAGKEQAQGRARGGQTAAGQPPGI